MCRQRSHYRTLMWRRQCTKGYNEGERDGTNAALNGQSNECPQSNGLSGYCLGFGSGWNKVSYAQNTLNEANSNNHGNNNNNDDDN